MYRALDLSKYIVAKCVDDGEPISNLQLQKILYYIQESFLKRGERAFSDAIEVWRFEPAVPDVYYRYCGFGANTIDFSCEKFAVKEQDKAEIDKIIESKRILEPWTLVAEVHKENGAWAQTYQNGAGDRAKIPVELIASKSRQLKFFKKRRNILREAY